ncbi:riboflavin synthase alpha chain [Tenacibaculum sp. MAR_2009_124]|uniref:riboflavin synthase n=1 Tax=Tenacibaculum sp. MAR_2009_124 TaxID=1250059 RepID=UPI00089B12D0|nr:riboflavin synthase [Tenacibaculum sp. MAR_2009_124]SED22884.1 riboflavin synthase alpha chain [Tenacibaculum sp. MAR_2009_124]
MFTGIIETLGIVTKLEKDQENVHLTVKSDFTNELKIDQSIAHNGVCLTVVGIEGEEYVVTAIKETIDKTNVGDLKVNDVVNLERGMKLGARLDGHIVQGHVDGVAECVRIEDAEGSTIFTFKYDFDGSNVTIEKGSITVNGVSLTVVNSKKDEFSVAIIPFTLDQTTFKNFKEGTRVNLEFDVIGKYVARLHQLK